MKDRLREILLVDDSEIIIKRLISCLHDVLPNTHVAAVFEGGAALSALQIVEPSVVLLDIQLPDISGIQILKSIRISHPHVKVIMLTNQSSPRIQKLCMKEGATGFYDKTKDFEKAIEHLKQLNNESKN